MLSLFRRSLVTAARRSKSAFHWAFVKPEGLGIGVADSVARRGDSYFFNGMAGESGENGGNCGGDGVVGRERRKTVGKSTGVADSGAPRAFLLQPVPPGAPRCAGFGLGSLDVISAQTGKKRGSEGAAGTFSFAGEKKVPGGVEML